MGALTVVSGRKSNGDPWIQESYETGSGEARRRAAELRSQGWRVTSESMGAQVTQWGRIRLTLVSATRAWRDNPRRRNPGPRDKRGRFVKRKRH